MSVDMIHGNEAGEVPLELDINRAVNGLFLVRNLHQERPFMVMLISYSRGTRLIDIHCIAYLEGDLELELGKEFGWVVLHHDIAHVHLGHCEAI